MGVTVIAGVGIAIWTREKPAPSPSGLNIMFVGNSFTYENSMPTMLGKMLEYTTHRKPRIADVTKGGWTLEKHIADGVPQLIEKQKPWDYVILQDASTVPFRDRTKLIDAVPVFRDAAQKANAKTVLFQTWSDREEPKKQTQHDYAYYYASQKHNVPVVPVGDAFWFTRRAYPSIELYAADKHHPSLAGTYLGACMFYEYITGKSAVGLPAPAKISEADALALQKIASSWLKSTTKPAEEGNKEKVPSAVNAH